MGRKTQETRKRNEFRCRNLSECQRTYLTELAAIATLARGYVVSESAIMSEIVGRQMRQENYACCQTSN